MPSKRSLNHFVISLSSDLWILLLLGCIHLDQAADSDLVMRPPQIESESLLVLDDVWHKQQVWRALADKKKKLIGICHGGKFVLCGVAIATQLYGATSLPAGTPSQVLSLGGGVAGVATIETMNRIFINKKDIEGVTCRRVADAIKSEVYRFQALKRHLYDVETKNLRKEVEEIVKDVVDPAMEEDIMTEYDILREEITKEPVPTPPSDNDEEIQDWYIQNRFDHLITYRKKKMQKADRIIKTYGIVKTFLPYGVSMKPVLSSVGPLYDAILASASALFVSHHSSSAIKENLKRRRDSKKDLEEARKGWNSRSCSWEYFVTKVEDIVRKENKQWADWIVEEGLHDNSELESDQRVLPKKKMK